MTKHIELFPGSKADLEDMTGETYQALRYEDSKLMRIETRVFAFGKNYPTNTKEEIDEKLRSIVRTRHADALIHFNYIYASGVEPEKEKTNIVGGFGYLVKRV